MTAPQNRRPPIDYRGLHADRPLPADLPAGSRYWSVDEPSAPGTWYVTDGTDWTIDALATGTVSLAAGITTGTVTIAETESLSGTIDLGAGARQLTNVRTPAVWTAASISFAVSDDDVTFVPLYYDGEELVILELAGAAASRGVSLPRDAFAGWAYVRVRSGTEAAPVAQAAARVLSVSSRA